jgi:hypothetical protein
LIVVVYVWQKSLALALKRPSLSSFRQLSPLHTGGAVNFGGGTVTCDEDECVVVEVVFFVEVVCSEECGLIDSVFFVEEVVWTGECVVVDEVE